MNPTAAPTLSPEVRAALDRVAGALTRTLGENLHSLLLYGSAARGTHVPGVSDLNLLILLEESTPEAHTAIADALQESAERVEPLILGRALLARSLQAFAVKFLSIRRTYRVLHGADPFRDLAVDPALARFECEQSARNLRLRITRAYVVFGRDRARYSTFVARLSSSIFTALAEALRQTGQDLPGPYRDRLPAFAKTFGADAAVLGELLDLKAAARTMSPDEVAPFHSRLFRLLDAAVRWMEATWPPLR